MLSVLENLVACSLAVAVQGAVITAQVHERSSAARTAVASDGGWGHQAQHPLIDHTHSYQLPLETNFTHELLYFTTVSLGTPPRPFRLLLSLNSPVSFVSSEACSACCAGGERYDPTQSSTSSGLGDAISYDRMGWLEVEGNVTSDALSLDNLSIPSQTFITGSRVQINGIAWDDLCQIHGMLGLTPSGKGLSGNLSTPLERLSSGGLLDDNIMAMRLREPRSLTFGGTNKTLHDGDIEYVPLTHDDSDSQWLPLKGRWQTSASYLSVVGRPGGVGARLPLNCTVAFATDEPWIRLPGRMSYDLLTELGFDFDVFMLPPNVDCDARAELPDLTFNLGEKNFTLTPWDYTLEWPLKGGKLRCVGALMPSATPQDDTPKVYLGTAFLRALYSVWDWERERIGFAKLSVL